MTDEQKQKLAKLKASKKKNPGLKLDIFSDDDLQAIHTKFADMQKLVSDALDSKYKDLTETQEKRFTEVNNTLVKLISAIERSANDTDVALAVKDALSNIKLPDYPNEIKVSNPTEIPKWLASNSTLEKTNLALGEVEKAVNKLDKPQNQDPGSYVPFRRVVKVGTRLVFDDNPTSQGGGGGNSGAVQISGASGGVATVTDGKLDVNATVQAAEGGSTSENQTNGSQKTQIVDSGGEAVTATGGKLDVNASIDTSGLATDTKQDAQTALLTTIDTSLNDIEASVEILDNAISGNEMQVDVVGALPTGNNNIGDVDVASSALPTGAATAAKQPALGTAGTSSADVITVQGRAAMTPILTDGSATTQPVSGTVTANAGSGTMAVSNAGLTELAAAINSNLVDVNIVSGAGSGGTAAADDADFTAGTTQGTPSMGVYESTPTTVTDGDLGTVGITSGRRLKTSTTIDAALPAGTNNIGDVDVLSSALPTGASTSAKQDTMIGHLDGVEGILTTIDGDTGNISTKIDTLAGAVAGSEMQVDVLTMPSVAVTNAGLTELASAINSNLVDVNIVSGAGSGGTAAADDADFTAGTTQGTPSMGVYESAPTTVTDGDLGTVGITSGRRLKTSATIDAALPAGTNAIGKLSANSGVDIGDVDVTSSALPTGASTSANQTTIIGHVDGIEGLLTTIAGDTTDIEAGVELLDDTVATLGTDTYTEASSKGLVIGAVRRDADTTLVNTTNEVAPLQVDANGRLKVEAFSGETLPVSLTSTTVTGTVAVTQSGTWDEVGINDSGNSITVDNGGTFATQVDGAALTALQLIDDTVFADDAGFTLGTHKGSVMEGVAVETDGTDPTTVSAEGDAAALRTDRQRLLIVNQTHPRFWHVSADYASAQTNTSVKAAPGASLSLYLTDISISNGATAGNVTLLDGSGGTVLYELYPAINGGAVMSLRSPIKLTANTALCITSTTVTTHSIFVSGYIAP